MMTKKEMICAIANEKHKAADVKEILEAFIGCVENQLMTEESAYLPGLGKLVVSHRKARAGRNPRTGEAIEIPARNSITYRPSKSAKVLVNKLG